MTVEESEFNEGYISYKDDGASGGNPSLSFSKDLLLNTTQYLTYFCPPSYCSPSPLRHTFFLSLPISCKVALCQEIFFAEFVH